MTTSPRRNWNSFATFRDTVTLPLDGGGSLLAFHASPQSNTDDLLPGTPDTKLDTLLGEHEANVFACGHTHLPMVRVHRGAVLVNPGSVGMPFREFAGGSTPTILAEAQYGVIEVGKERASVDLRKLHLDGDMLRRAAVEWGTSLGAWLGTQYE